LKTINLHEKFNFKSKNLITYLVEVKYWKVKEKRQNCKIQVFKKKMQMQEIGEINKKMQESAAEEQT
jgi:hypothetical protein